MFFLTRAALLKKFCGLRLAHEKKAGSNPVIIPYKAINRSYNTLYGIITGRPIGRRLALLTVKKNGCLEFATDGMTSVQ